jgi:hypothetical protein
MAEVDRIKGGTVVREKVSTLARDSSAAKGTTIALSAIVAAI